MNPRNRTSHIYGAERDLQTDEGWACARVLIVAALIASALIAGWKVSALIWRPRSAQAQPDTTDHTEITR